jgi:hypothetical protein
MARRQPDYIKGYRNREDALLELGISEDALEAIAPQPADLAAARRAQSDSAVQESA